MQWWAFHSARMNNMSDLFQSPFTSPWSLFSSRPMIIFVVLFIVLFSGKSRRATSLLVWSLKSRRLCFKTVLGSSNHSINKVGGFFLRTGNNKIRHFGGFFLDYKIHIWTYSFRNTCNVWYLDVDWLNRVIMSEASAIISVLRFTHFLKQVVGAKMSN